MASGSQIRGLWARWGDLILYGLFGVLTTVVNVVTYWVCAHPFGIPTLPSSVVAWVAAVAFAYLTNRKWVFHSKASGVSEIAREVLSFFAARLATGALDWAAMWLFVDVANLPDLPVKLATNVAVIVLNYVASKLVVFRGSSREPAAEPLERGSVNCREHEDQSPDGQAPAGNETPKEGRATNPLSVIAIASLALLSLAAILVILLDTSFGLGAYKTNAPPASNILLVTIVLSLLAVSWLLVRKLHTRQGRLSERLTDRPTLYIELGTTIALFVFHLVCLYCIGIASGWDVGIVRGIVLSEDSLLENLPNDSRLYLLHFPNNHLLIAILRAVGKASCKFLPTLNPAASFAVLSSVCVCASVFVCSRAVLRLYKSNTMSLASHALGIALVGLSPWHMIPYTDTLSLPFVAGMAYAAVRMTRDRQARWWLLCGALGYLAYRMKASAIFLLGTIVLAAVINLASRVKEDGPDRNARMRRIVRPLGGLAVGLLSSYLVATLAIGTLGLPADAKNYSYPVEYFLVFGLSETGKWNTADYQLAAEQPDRETLTQVERSLALQRIKDYGPIGFARHSLEKLMRTYNDGTFAWGLEGGFYHTTRETTGAIADALRSFYYNNGTLFPVFCAFAQAIWLFVLIGIPAGLIYIIGRGLSREDAAVIAALASSLVLLTLYLVVFETRARYLLHYAPVFVFLTTWGYSMLASRVRQVTCLGSRRASP